MLKQYKVAVAVLLVVALLVAFGCAPKPVEEEEVEVEVEGEAVEVKTATIGLLGALTGPLRGIAASIYVVEDYMAYLNEKGGLEYKDPKTGKTEYLKFEWLEGDHGWDSSKCISLYERFKATGAMFMVTNGSVPSVSVYALMARDHIPGVENGAIGEVCMYEIEEPYLLANGCFMPQVLGATAALYIKRLWDKPGTPKIGVLAADVGSRRVYDLPEAGTYKAVEALGGELLPIEYIPIAPIDVKIQINRLVDQGADMIWQDHWGEGANRVFMHNAIDLKLWEKDILLWPAWLDIKVSLAEPDVWDTYERMGGELLLGSGGACWTGSQQEYDKYCTNPQFWGLKLGYDLCKKYHDVLPEMTGCGGWYMWGMKDVMLIERVFKETLEKYGYEGLSGETLRESLFSLEGPIDTGGVAPPTAIDYAGGQPVMGDFCGFSVMKNGHCIFDPAVYPWVEATPVWGRRWNPSTADLGPEWSKYVVTNYMEVIE